MPTIVDSTESHLWTDALHARQLAREALNKWDRGTYVRMCVTTNWTAIEVACQEALDCTSIGYRFKENVDGAVASALLPPINWSLGVWQKVRLLQELRKSHIHRFTSLSDMFPPASVADDATETARNAIERIFAHAGKPPPTWIGLDEAHGWQAHSSYRASVLTACHAGAQIDDPSAVRVFLVIKGEEKLTAVLPVGSDPSSEVDQLLHNVSVPIDGIRVYENGELKRDLVVSMRGNS